MPLQAVAPFQKSPQVQDVFTLEEAFKFPFQLDFVGLRWRALYLKKLLVRLFFMVWVFLPGCFFQTTTAKHSGFQKLRTESPGCFDLKHHGFFRPWCFKIFTEAVYSRCKVRKWQSVISEIRGVFPWWFERNTSDDLRPFLRNTEYFF